jgi:hypothetical protein
VDLEGFAQRQRSSDAVGAGCRLAPAGACDEVGTFGGAAGRAVAADPQQMTIRITDEQQMTRFSHCATQNRQQHRPYRCQMSRPLPVPDLVVSHHDLWEMAIRMQPDALGTVPRRTHITAHPPSRATGKRVATGLHHLLLIHVIHRSEPAIDPVAPRYEARCFMDNPFQILVQRSRNPRNAVGWGGLCVGQFR